MPKSSNSEAGAATPKLDAAPWILIVDDESMILQLIETVLADRGWGVIIANGAESAFAVVNAAPTPPAVMICDVIMPKTDGLELTRRMIAQIPDLSVILISGHLADSAWWPADLGRIRLLKKPFLNEDLVNAVREALFNRNPGI
jgi:DNA-binding NtrC family response regulator